MRRTWTVSMGKWNSWICIYLSARFKLCPLSNPIRYGNRRRGMDSFNIHAYIAYGDIWKKKSAISRFSHFSFPIVKMFGADIRQKTIHIHQTVWPRWLYILIRDDNTFFLVSELSLSTNDDEMKRTVYIINACTITAKVFPLKPVDR